MADDVARFGSDTKLRSLTADDLQPGSGYLLELLPGAGPAPLTAVDVDRLCDQLASSECYLVLITQHDIRCLDAFHGYVADCPVPDSREVLDRAVKHESRLRPDLEADLRQAAADVQPDGPGGARTPSEVGWLVAHVVSRAEGKITSDELARLSKESLTRNVSGWFEPLASLPASAEGDEQVRIGAFRIALAVLNDTPFDLVAEAAESLTWQILITRSPWRTPGRPVFAAQREDFVANSRAHLAPGTVKFIDASAPAAFVAYDDDRLPIAILRHVWAVHNVRGPLIAWLQSLSNDARPFVYTRAALAIGLLSSWDFSYTFHELIEPWAMSSKKKAHRRWAAAIALDEASRNDDVLPVVREILETWCRKGTFAQRWTGATALGYDLGLRDPSKALKEMRRLACWEDGDLAQVASWTVARIFALGGIEPVLKALQDWLRDDRLAVRELALLAVLRIADMKVSDLEDLDMTSQTAGGRWTRLAHRNRWPLPVALAHEDPGLLDPLADLVWRLTRTAPAQLPVLEALTKWMRAGEKDRACVGPVGRFLALLGDDAADRARLQHLVSALRRDRDEPLPAEIADRYACAIEKNIHTEDEMG